jgi:hypothetical protein
MAEADKNERWWSSGGYLMELWDTGPHQEPTRKKDKKRDNRPKKETKDEQTDMQSWDRKRQ